MPDSFSISSARFSDLSRSDLHREIQAHTGNESETDSIIRSMTRFGDDATIRSYEFTPRPRRRTARGGPDSTWTVRAVR